MPASLNLEVLTNAVSGGAAAIRTTTRLQPAGGTGDKIFPPTYAVSDQAESKYALEERRLDGRVVKTVLLDSVASQANRMEQALLGAWRDGDLDMPVVLVDFSGEEGLEDLDEITTLDAPHRIADALLRDSLLDGTLFRYSEPGRAFTDASLRDAGALFRYCPTALVFGMWDSTGPKGGMGSKFERALVSEIVGVDVVPGLKVASRIDPAQIELKAGPVFEARDRQEEWTLDPDEAVLEKKKPAEFSRGGKSDRGKPSGINHGNIAPSIDTRAGGVTMDHALQTTVLSMAALRRLRFPVDFQGQRLDREQRREAELSVRTALAALALAAVVYAREDDYDLRSRCVLVAEEPLVFELISRHGGEPESFELTPDQAAQLLMEAASAAAEHGFAWTPEPIRLVPAPKLSQLIRRSRELSARHEGEDE